MILRIPFFVAFVLCAGKDGALFCSTQGLNLKLRPVQIALEGCIISSVTHSIDFVSDFLSLFAVFRAVGPL